MMLVIVLGGVEKRKQITILASNLYSETERIKSEQKNTYFYLLRYLCYCYR